MKKKYNILVAVFCCFFGIVSAENISIIGIGRLGLPFALLLEDAGHKVVGVDVSEKYVQQLNDRTFLTSEPHINEYLAKADHFLATTSLEEGINFSDIYFICVPTNSIQEVKSYDTSIISDVLSRINSYKPKDKTIVIISTLFPEYIDLEGRPLLKDCENVTLNYNPEFVAQGTIIKNYQNPDLILIGQETDEAGELVASIHRSIVKNNPYEAHLNVQSAEIAKLALNCFLTTKIAFANFVGDLADVTVGADKHAILKAIGHDSRVGNKFFKPGYGFGGTCLPRDNRALANFAKTKELDPIIFETTDNANKAHTKFMVDQLLKQDLDEYVFENVNFKEDNCTLIIEESQKLEVARQLALLGKKVTIIDASPIISLIKDEYGDIFRYIHKDVTQN